jgi:hypothetical protein
VKWVPRPGRWLFWLTAPIKLKRPHCLDIAELLLGFPAYRRPRTAGKPHLPVSWPPDFYLHHLKLGADGRYHCGQSNSPEQNDTADDKVFDPAVIERCLRSAINAARLLDCDAGCAAAWRDRLLRLFDYPQDERTVCETLSNRHPFRCQGSVMFPVFPSATVEPGAPLWNKLGATCDVMLNLIGHNPAGRHVPVPGHGGDSSRPRSTAASCWLRRRD